MYLDIVPLSIFMYTHINSSFLIVILCFFMSWSGTSLLSIRVRQVRVFRQEHTVFHPPFSFMSTMHKTFFFLRLFLRFYYGHSIVLQIDACIPCCVNAIIFRRCIAVKMDGKYSNKLTLVSLAV